jgi:hypothetical protein
MTAKEYLEESELRFYIKEEAILLMKEFTKLKCREQREIIVKNTDQDAVNFGIVAVKMRIINAPMPEL